jgi:DNA replication and repair protein RecF
VFLRSLQLLHYKNYSAARVAFSQKFTLVNGRNGSGKTNLIDAVHYLCLCKSYFTRSDAQVMQHENDFFRIDGSVEFADRTLDITCKYQFAKKRC